MRSEPVINSTSLEEHQYLERAYNELNDNYEIRTDFGALEVKKFLENENIVSVYPHDEKAKIKNITRRKKDLGGLLKSTSDFCLIELGDKRYDIQYKNPSNNPLP